MDDATRRMIDDLLRECRPPAAELMRFVTEMDKRHIDVLCESTKGEITLHVGLWTVLFRREKRTPCRACGCASGGACGSRP